MPIRVVSASRSATRAAPSSMEYSVCTCRWANESPAGDGRPGCGTRVDLLRAADWRTLFLLRGSVSSAHRLAGPARVGGQRLGELELDRGGAVVQLPGPAGTTVAEPLV